MVEGNLMDLPAAGMVDPAKAREVSRALPVRFWIDTQELIGLLKPAWRSSRRTTRTLRRRTPANRVLISQRALDQPPGGDGRGRHLHRFATFPASFAGDEYDQEEAVTE